MNPELDRADEVLDMAAFDRLFGEYRPRFLRFAAGYVADPADAEDIVMESFAAAWRHRDTLTTETFPPYTLTIVKNKCLNRLRGQSRRLRAAEKLHTHHMQVLRTRIATLEACNPEELFSKEARRIVDQTLAQMPERTREIFIRSRFRGQSYKEIADEMGITVKSVEFEISKAMKRLRIALKDYLAFFVFWFTIN